MATPEAVIEIGSIGIRLLVVQVKTNGGWEVLDFSELPVALGRDVFTTGSISRSNLVLCLQILSRFKEQLEGWGIKPEQTLVIATSALREAKNPDPITDRIFIKTGFKVRVIDGIEENRLMYLAVTNKIKLLSKKNVSEDSIILEVGGGSTEMMLIKEGKMAGAHSLKIGTIRIEQNLNLPAATNDDIRRYIHQFILNTKGSLNEDLDMSTVKQFYSVGGEPRLAAKTYGRQIADGIWEISRKEYEKFVKEIETYSPEELVAKFKIDYNEASSLYIGLSIYEMFIQLTNVEKIIVLETNIREGVIISQISKPSEELQSEFYSQITASAINLLRKYHGDLEHAFYVRDVSLKIFDTLKDEIGLDARTRMLLEVAGILHDIGMFIRLGDHQHHSQYIISNSEIFGLRPFENTIIAQIAKFHRGSTLPQDDEQFSILPRSDRMIILKLTAILRIADALDRAHQQKLSDLFISKQNDTLFINTRSSHNILLEKQALQEKANIFEYVFGYRIVLS
ncbi:MAG: HD domain-containing protein [Treponema sp.]|uniref:Ppx/GppA phosphatase family protein n=1 Tax=Treponema sp. TaxID=166 RepID=UPI001B580927|nr:HD domain-containing protein [Treponema sp.]MBP5587838.1 HD domain-containing protein [Treponema sp.]MBR0154555.1 HD domain-containing protein [Treponema sp.]MCR5386560.1 HD domain-containing protein [Treponema sp.]